MTEFAERVPQSKPKECPPHYWFIFESPQEPQEWTCFRCRLVKRVPANDPYKDNYPPHAPIKRDEGGLFK